MPQKNPIAYSPILSGMSWVVVVTTWVDGEAEPDAGLTARATTCRERNTQHMTGFERDRKFVGTKISGPGSRGGRANWASFRGMSWVVVATTWVSGEAGSDAGLTAQVTTR